MIISQLHIWIWVDLPFCDFISVQFSCSLASNSSKPYRLQHARLPCNHQLPELNQSHDHRVSDAIQPSHPLSSPFSSRLQSFPASGSFQMSQFFTSGDQSIRVSASASVLPMNIQDWFPLGRTGWISWQSRGLSRVFSNTTVHIYTNNSVYLMSITFKIFFSYW